jgi:hypothetical protein
MGKASSAKKVARAARASGSTKQRKHNWAFPAGIAMIVIVGALVVFVARAENQTAAAVAPTTDDHWHSAIGIYVCDAFLPAVADGPTDVSGIHTHGDGIIHIHPFQGAAAGKNAKMQVFADQVGLSFSDSGFTTPDGTTYENGYDCNGTPSVVTVSQWNSIDSVKADPEAPPDVVYTDDFGSIPFENDRMAFTLAVAPEGTTIPPPDSVATVDQLDPITDAPSTSLDVSGLTGSSTTLPGATSSTVAGATDSTAVGTPDSTATTVAGATNPTATTSP